MILHETPFRPGRAPALRYDAREADRQFRLRGSNCGPGAIAGVCGFALDEVLDALGSEFDRRRATTEIMLTRALDDLDVSWVQTPPKLPSFGLARVQWDGPWCEHPDPFEKLRHSHWIGTAIEGQDTWIFDFNAIAVGGWISIEEWDTNLRPWLLESCEPRASGAWWVSDAYELVLPANSAADASSSGKSHDPRIEARSADDPIFTP